MFGFGADPDAPLKSSQKLSVRPEGGVSAQAPDGVGVGVGVVVVVGAVVVSAVVVVGDVLVVGAVVVVQAVVVVDPVLVVQLRNREWWPFEHGGDEAAGTTANPSTNSPQSAAASPVNFAPSLNIPRAIGARQRGAYPYPPVGGCHTEAGCAPRKTSLGRLMSPTP